MQNSQLIAVLKTLTKKEGREFKKWLHSPFHNHRKDVIALYEYLQKNEHLHKNAALTKARIYSKIFPLQPFDDAKIRQTIHFLQKQLDDYLAYKEFKEDDLGNKITQFKAYRRRKLEKPVRRIISSIENAMDSYPYQDREFLWNNYLFQQQIFDFYATQERKRSVQYNLQEVVDALDQAYFADKIRLSCTMLQHKRVFKTEYNEGVIDAILEYVQTQNLLKLPAISVYYYIYKTYPETETEEFFYQLRDALNENLKFFPETDAKDILLMAIYYCIERMNRGKEIFVRESFELYKRGVESKLIIESNRIPRWDFNNIVRLGSQLGEFNWVYAFIEDYQIYLDPKDRENIVHFCKAKLFYAQGKYDASMQELIMVREDDILLNLSSKHTLLKIYYETDEFEPLDSLLDSMGRYIRRKDIPSNYRMVYESIIRLIKKMSRANPNNRDLVKNLREEIRTAPALPSSERTWFMKQIELL